MHAGADSQIARWHQPVAHPVKLLQSSYHQSVYSAKSTALATKWGKRNRRSQSARWFRRVVSFCQIGSVWSLRKCNCLNLCYIAADELRSAVRPLHRANCYAGLQNKGPQAVFFFLPSQTCSCSSIWNDAPGPSFERNDGGNA